MPDSVTSVLRIQEMNEEIENLKSKVRSQKIKLDNWQSALDRSGLVEVIAEGNRPAGMLSTDKEGDVSDHSFEK